MHRDHRNLSFDPRCVLGYGAEHAVLRFRGVIQLRSRLDARNYRDQVRVPIRNRRRLGLGGLRGFALDVRSFSSRSRVPEVSHIRKEEYEDDESDDAE